ncbi:hypothetical protein [Bacillus sp. 03113]|uniref:hypothetical protein n=1 Tax=Bacillus sp. 03113 TaxID=2578211 RepID=UPI00114199D8|nr:hypothetical protein [Bacillus sp. 03113]
MKTQSKKSFSCWLLIILHCLLGVGAILGGGGLIISPKGDLLHMPLSLLQNTPFHSFLLPGFLLFIFLGILPLMVVIYLITEKPCKTAELFNIYKDFKWSWTYSFYIGVILIIWITIEAYLIHSFVFVHVAYIFLGLSIQIVTLLPSVKQNYTLK